MLLLINSGSKFAFPGSYTKPLIPLIYNSIQNARLSWNFALSELLTFAVTWTNSLFQPGNTGHKLLKQ
jgi:hypothetical protein